jgi:hypothetical protein
MRKKVLLHLFISQKSKISIFSLKNDKDEFSSYMDEFTNSYILNDELVKKNRFFIGIINLDEKFLTKAFFIVSIRHESIAIVDGLKLREYLKNFFSITNLDQDLHDLYVVNKLKQIENIVQNFCKQNNIFDITFEKLSYKIIPFSELEQINLYNKIKRG